MRSGSIQTEKLYPLTKFNGKYLVVSDIMCTFALSKQIKTKRIMETKFREIGDQVEVLMSELRKESIKYITDAVKNNGSISIYDEDENDPVYVSYDGGSHPEYASNLYSMVYDAHINTAGKLALCIEDSDDYEIDRCSTMEIYEVACMIDNLFGDDEDQDEIHNDDQDEQINIAKKKIEDACVFMQDVIDADDYELADSVIDLVDSYLESHLPDYER